MFSPLTISKPLCSKCLKSAIEFLACDKESPTDFEKQQAPVHLQKPSSSIQIIKSDMTLNSS